MGLGCMKRVIVTAFFIFICFLLQCTVFRALAFGGIVPNLLIVLTASFGFMRGEKTGLLIGFYALLYMYIGYANGKFSAIFYPEDIKLPITLILCSDFAYGIICYMILFLLRGKFDFQYYLVHIILPEIVYTVVVTLFLYPVILRVNRSLEQKEKRGEKKFV